MNRLRPVTPRPDLHADVERATPRYFVCRAALDYAAARVRAASAPAAAFPAALDAADAAWRKLEVALDAMAAAEFDKGLDLAHDVLVGDDAA